jgi:hypothetical protein
LNFRSTIVELTAETRPQTRRSVASEQKKRTSLFAIFGIEACRQAGCARRADFSGHTLPAGLERSEGIALLSFDATLVTALVPLFIPSRDGNCGDLISFPDIRPLVAAPCSTSSKRRSCTTS